MLKFTQTNQGLLFPSYRWPKSTGTFIHFTAASP